MKTFEMTYCYKDEYMKKVYIRAEDWVDARRKLRHMIGIRNVSQLDWLHEKEI